MKKIILVYALILLGVGAQAHATLIEQLRDIKGAIFPPVPIPRAVTVVPDGEFAKLDASTMLPGTVYYSERPMLNAPVPKQSPRLLFTEWQKIYPDEKDLLSIFPGFKENNALNILTGKTELEPLVVFEIRSKTLITKAAEGIDLPGVIKPAFINQMDPKIRNVPISANQAMTAIKDHTTMANFGGCNVHVPARETTLESITNPQREWCSNNPHSICVESCYTFPLRIRTGISIFNTAFADDETSKDTSQATQSEMGYFLKAEEIGATEAQLKKLTGIDTPVRGGLVQTLFYANQLIKTTKTISILQPKPGNPNQTVMTTIFTATTKLKTWNLASGTVGQALQGKFDMNTDQCEITDGLPRYFQCSISRLANEL